MIVFSQFPFYSPNLLSTAEKHSSSFFTRGQSAPPHHLLNGLLFLWPRDVHLVLRFSYNVAPYHRSNRQSLPLIYQARSWSTTRERYSMMPRNTRSSVKAIGDQPNNNQSDDHDMDDVEPVGNYQVALTQALTASVAGITSSFDVLGKASAALQDVMKTGSAEQKLHAAESARLNVETTNATIEKATNFFLAIGVKVCPTTSVSLNAVMPDHMINSGIKSREGYETDKAMPTASKYSLNMKYTKPQTILPMVLAKQKLMGSGCQQVDRISSATDVTIRFETKAQLDRAYDILRNADLDNILLSSFCMFTISTQSAYAVRSAPFPRSSISSWLNSDNELVVEKAIKSLRADNEGWFPDQDVESVEMITCKHTPNNFADTDGPFCFIKIFVSQACYRHFLRSDRSITKIDLPDRMVMVYEEPTIVQCYRCFDFGHRASACRKNNCRSCLSNHPPKARCPLVDTPQCINCTTNNQLFKELAAKDPPQVIPHYPDWSPAKTDHLATSGACRCIQIRKNEYLLQLKQAAFNKQPLPPFKFP